MNLTKIKFLFLIFLFFSACKQSPLLVRITANYFPIKEGNKWIYLHNGKDTITVECIRKETIYGKEAYLIERDGVPEYWNESLDAIEFLYSHYLFIRGQIDTIGSFWIKYLELPLIENNYWEKEYEGKKEILGDTVKVKIKFYGKVIGLEKNEIYKVRISMIKQQETNNFGEYIDTSIYYQWFAPNIGMIKQTYNGNVDTIISYFIK